MKHSLSILATLAVAFLVFGCSENTVNFPVPIHATARIVNVTSDVDTLTVIVDYTTTVKIPRGEASPPISISSGRPAPFVLMEGDEMLRRDTLYYTFGSGSSLALYAKGTKTNTVEFLRAVPDTGIDASNGLAYIRFSHMATERSDGEPYVDMRIGPKDSIVLAGMEPGKTKQFSVAPGAYAFTAVQEGTTTTVAALPQQRFEAGVLYTIYLYFENATTFTQPTLKIFDNKNP